MPRYDPEADALTEGSRPVRRPPPPENSTAALFRRERIVRMRSLGDVADQLKLREFYLQAIEDGAFEDLPLGTYAVGFVRAYADLLGLDSAEIVERFKAEAAQATARASGTHEQPLPAFPARKKKKKARIPSAAIALISLLLVVTLYGGWLTRSSVDTSQVNQIQEAPAADLLGRE